MTLAEMLADDPEDCSFFAAGPWIPVTERLPEPHPKRRHLCRFDESDNEYEALRFTDHGWEHPEYSGLTGVTHWCEIRGPK